MFGGIYGGICKNTLRKCLSTTARCTISYMDATPTFAKASVGRPLGVSAEALCFCEDCPPTKSTVASAKVEAAGACEGDWRRGAFTFGWQAIRRVSRSLVFLRRLPSDEVHRSFSEGGSRLRLRRRLAKGGFHLHCAFNPRGK